MGKRDVEDEPVSPAGRFFLQPEIDQIIHCIIGFEHPVDIPSLTSEFQRTLLHYHPRLKCLLVKDNKGREHWRPAPTVNINDHIIIADDDEDADVTVEDYVANLAVSSPLPLTKPLWEIHMLPRRRTCVFRLHHALGDGVALVSLFLASCERADDPTKPLHVPGGRKRRDAVKSPLKIVWTLIRVLFFSIIFVVKFLLRSSFVKDEKSPIKGGAGVELWPRKLVTVTFDLAEIKDVKSRINATVNDVLVGIVAGGLAKYFGLKSSDVPRKTIRITGLSMVNLRRTPGLQEFYNKVKAGTSEWGNKIGYMLLPLCLQSDIADPLEYVKQARAVLRQKKESLEANFSYHGGTLLLSMFGPRVATNVNYRIICNTSFSLSNVVGPSEKVMFAKNPIEFCRFTTSSVPQALLCQFITYNGKADLQLLVAKDIIHDPDTLASCFQDCLREMLNSDISKTK